jgi:3-dehydroquinate synthase
MVLRGLEEFREHLGGQLTITLLQRIGQGFEVHDMQSSAVIAAIHELEERAQRRVQARVVAMFRR